MCPGGVVTWPSGSVGMRIACASNVLLMECTLLFYCIHVLPALYTLARCSLTRGLRHMGCTLFALGRVSASVVTGSECGSSCQIYPPYILSYSSRSTKLLPFMQYALGCLCEVGSVWWCSVSCGLSNSKEVGWYFVFVPPCFNSPGRVNG